MSRIKDEAENIAKTKIKQVFIKTLGKYLLIPITVILAFAIAIAFWVAGASAGRRFW